MSTPEDIAAIKEQIVEVLEKVETIYSDFEDELEEIRKAIEKTQELVKAAPNTPDTVLEKNQHTIYDGIVEAIKMLRQLGAKIEEITPDPQEQNQP